MKNILSGIDITVENCLASKANPVPIFEGQSVIDPPALELSQILRRLNSLTIGRYGEVI